MQFMANQGGCLYFLLLIFPRSIYIKQMQIAKYEIYCDSFYDENIT